MELINAIFSNTIIAFIIMVSVVVFIHELGHFVMGKILGIKVEEFSIGFGPKILGFTLRETEYRVNWLPLGGYVRFFGSDLSNELTLEMQEQSISHGKVYKRFLVYAAGPLANFLLSFLILAVVSWHGYPQLSTQVSVLRDSPADKAGLMDGDKILTINSKETQTWSELIKSVQKDLISPFHAKIEREDKVYNYEIIPFFLKTQNHFGESVTQARLGISPFFSSANIMIEKGSFLEKIGLKNHDTILEVNGRKIKYLYEFRNELMSILKSLNLKHIKENLKKEILLKSEFTIKIKRYNKVETFSPFVTYREDLLNWTNNSKHNDTLLLLPSSDLTIKGIKENYIKQNVLNEWAQCGIKENVTIVSSKTPLFSRMDLNSQLVDLTKVPPTSKKVTPVNASINLDIIDSQGLLKNTTCRISYSEGRDHFNKVQKNIDFPFIFFTSPITSPSIIVKSTSFKNVFKDGFNLLKEQMTVIFEGIRKLLTGSIPLSNLGGPISIANTAGAAAKAGFLAFVLTLSIISLNIGMINLIPLPALDGGGLILCLVEAIYGKRLPMRFQATVQRLGIVFFLILFIIVFYNDILRILSQ